MAATAAMVLAGTATACAAKVEQKAPEEAKTEELGRAEGKARHFRGPVARVIETVKLHGNLDADQKATVARAASIAAAATVAAAAGSVSRPRAWTDRAWT